MHFWVVDYVLAANAAPHGSPQVVHHPDYLRLSVVLFHEHKDALVDLD